MSERAGKQYFKHRRELGQVPRVLQKGGHVLSKRTRKALGLTRDGAKSAIETLKTDLLLPKNFHGIIMSNGDFLHLHTREFLGNILEYAH